MRSLHRALLLTAVAVAVAMLLAPAGAAAQDTCPNAEIRAQQGSQYLPHCRAYEMMTPEYTQGGNRIAAVSITADGDRAALGTAGIFAGTEGMVGQGGSYMMSRTETGWKTTPLNPPASLFWRYAGGTGETSPDGLTTMWAAAPRTKVNSNYVAYYFRTDDGEGNGTWQPATPELKDELVSIDGYSSDGQVVVMNLQRERLVTSSGVIDTRPIGNSASMYRIARNLDGSFGIDQIAYRDGATMYPGCSAGIGFGHTPATTTQGAVSPGATRIIFGFRGGTACRTAEVQRVFAWTSNKGVIDLSASKCTGLDCGGEQPAKFEGMSRDGRRAYFTTAQKLVNGDGAADVAVAKRINLYEYDFDRAGNELRPVTVSADLEGAGVVRLVRLSEDGSRAYFVANGRPLAGENERGESPLPNRNNLYVYHRPADASEGTITFVATLVAGSGDNSMWGQDQARNIHAYPADGRFLVVQSSQDITGEKLPGDSRRDLYWYDAETEEIKRIWSDDPAHNGAARVDQPSTANRPWVGSASPWRWYRSRIMSDDGRWVVFNTSEPLDARDTNEASDVYLWDSTTSEISLISGGRSLAGAEAAGAMTPDGSTITFTTDEQLLLEHTSTGLTAYAARIGGGFPPTRVPDPAPCTGDACQGAAPAPPAAPTPASSQLEGDGNVSTPASVGVRKRMRVVGRVAMLNVRVPDAGRIAVTGSALRRTNRSAPRAGNYRLRIALKPRARKLLRKRSRLTVNARVVFRASDGEATSRKISIAFTQRKARR